MFREDGDSERKRIVATPGSEKMLLKLERFVEKLKDVKDSTGRSVSTPETASNSETEETYTKWMSQYSTRRGNK